MNYCIFKDIDSRELGLFMERCPEKISPKRRDETFTIPGRHGNLTTTDGAFETYIRSAEFISKDEKKIKNTKIIMSLIEEKRNNDSKKLIEKWEKRTFYVNRAILSKPIVTKKRNLSQDSIKYNEEIKKENEKDNIYNYMNVTEED